MLRRLVVLLALVLGAAPLGAQATEVPEPFDSAGRVEVVTPTIAARLQLLPPAWRITGDYEGARLFRLSDDAYVVVVTRRDGTVERYAITGADRAYLRAKTSTLPPDLETQIRGAVREAPRVAFERASRNAFIRNQTLLGLTVYAPSFAWAVTNDEAGRVATYLLVAGASYFGASTLSRDITITEPMNDLATSAALKGGLAGWAIASALDSHRDGQAASIFVGSLAGTAAGLWFGQGMTESQVAAAGFGSSALAVAAAGALQAIDKGPEDISWRAQAGIVAGMGLVGYPLGAIYPRRASYNVTEGDIGTLWVSGIIGAASASTITAGSGTDESARWISATAGFVGGVVLGDRLIVSRYDYTQGDAGLLALGTGAGGLMGAGVYALIDRDRSNDPLLVGLASLGGIAGAGLTHYYLVPRADAGRVSGRIRFSPEGAALAAAGVRGAHPVLSISF